MQGLMTRWLTLTAAITCASYLIEGIRVRGFFTALVTAAILGFLNAFFRPVLLILTLPINIMTLGLFTFVINAVLLKMASGLISGFDVRGFWSAVFGALIISLVNWVLSSLLGDYLGGGHVGKGGEPPEPDYIDLEKKDDGSWE